MAQSQSDRLNLSYPPNNHKTTAEQIFFIGSAPTTGTVTLNGKTLDRSDLGHFAPSLPLKVGPNTFTIQYKNTAGKTEDLRLTIERLAANNPAPVTGLEELYPAVNIARQPGELICFQAKAPENAQAISVTLANQTIELKPDFSVSLPPNSAILTFTNDALTRRFDGLYQGCSTFTQVGDLGQPLYRLTHNGATITQVSGGAVEILDPQKIEAIAVSAEAGVARTGASTNFSRLTPLPQGSQARITGKEGDWLRLDYGAWIKTAETVPLNAIVPPHSIVRSLRSQTTTNSTDVIIPLQSPVPVTVEQTDDTFSLILHNTTAQTDTIYLDKSPLIRRLDWYQVAPGIVRYDFRLKESQQWGYELYYEDRLNATVNLVLSLRHSPQLASNSLQGATILLDPGHGGNESGSVGPTGYPEKAVNLVVSKKIQQLLEAKGAQVNLTRTEDVDVSLGRRQELIREQQPTLALSIHYNALPDAGDAENTAGIGMFWYNAQSHDLAQFLHDELTQNLGRESYGVFWNNLALTRPTEAPAVLLELGFMINPDEFEWITNPQAQDELAA
ncbi:MAG: N-acetylmuramoyl-L-alanine amidase, partial [Limnothrix sp. RL_2_0]|nr:N-acetylmuramoyl-L-alanine amidase [Limnothrix sp. RL_2_0]